MVDINSKIQNTLRIQMVKYIILWDTKPNSVPPVWECSEECVCGLGTLLTACMNNKEQYTYIDSIFPTKIFAKNDTNNNKTIVIF